MNYGEEYDKVELSIKKQLMSILINHVDHLKDEMNSVLSSDILDQYISLGANMAYDQMLALFETTLVELEFDDDSKAGHS